MAKFVVNIVLLCIVKSCFATNYLTLNDGHKIPTYGLGAWYEVDNLNQTVPSVTYGIELGFRLIDTAYIYATEPLVGEVLTDVFRRGVVKREDLFIITKVDIAVDTPEKVIAALKLALKRLRLEYVDLFLIHMPYNVFNTSNYDYLNVWKGFEDAQKLGLTKSIGVSNFNSTHVNRVLRYGKVRPAVNEIEVNPTYTSLDLAAYCQNQGIAVIAYGPLGLYVPRAFSNFTNPPTFADPTLVKIARKYGKQSNQVVLRYLMDRGLIPIPRSHNRAHLWSNFHIDDFRLTQNEVYEMNDLNLDAPSYPKGEELKEAFLEQYETIQGLQ